MKLKLLVLFLVCYISKGLCEESSHAEDCTSPTGYVVQFLKRTKFSGGEGESRRDNIKVEELADNNLKTRQCAGQYATGITFSSPNPLTLFAKFKVQREESLQSIVIDSDIEDSETCDDIGKLSAGERANIKKVMGDKEEISKSCEQSDTFTKCSFTVKNSYLDVAHNKVKKILISQCKTVVTPQELLELLNSAEKTEN